MYKKKYKYQTFNRRTIILSSIKSILISCLIARFYFLQISNSNTYQILSNKNRLRIIIIPALRGPILDINGIKLANNKKIYSLILKKKFKNSARNVIKKINSITKKQKISFQKIIKNLENNHSNQQIELIKNITLKEITLLDSNPNLTEIDITEKYIRQYELEKLIFHPIGYVGKLNLNIKYLTQAKKNYDFIIGKEGIEKKFNNELQGKFGIKKIEVDYKNSIKNINLIPPIEGKIIHTTINQKVQKLIWHHIEKYNGAILISDLKKQKIIGMASSPSIDPNIFVQNPTTIKWKKIIQNKYHPLVNKCISSQYSPGSIFKIVMFLSILENGINKNKKIFCPGYYKLGNKLYKCWKKYGHGYITLEEAFINSCNVYFFYQSLKIGIKKIYKMAKLLGLGQKTNINLPYEIYGTVPNIKWKKQIYSKNWYLGDTINSSIGQGYIETTPIQLLQMISRIATNRCYKPSILKNKNNDFIQKLSINYKHLHTFKKAMFKTVNNLTKISSLSNDKYKKLKIAGKTGTSQIISTKHNILNKIYKDHSLFIGYGPFDYPKFAISTIIENAGWGAKTAMPISMKIFYDLQYL